MRPAWLFSSVLLKRVDIDDVLRVVPELMSRFGLASYDAVHAATALRGNAVGIVTTDVGFASLPSTTAIYTDATRVARCDPTGATPRREPVRADGRPPVARNDNDESAGVEDVQAGT